MENLDSSQVVMIVDPHNPCALWPIGRIVEIYPGKDGKVRSAKVVIQGREYTRPISRLISLPEIRDSDWNVFAAQIRGWLCWIFISPPLHKETPSAIKVYLWWEFLLPALRRQIEACVYVYGLDEAFLLPLFSSPGNPKCLPCVFWLTIIVSFFLCCLH